MPGSTRLHPRQARARGVTLLEVLVVVTVIGIIAGIAYPGVTSGLDNLRLKSVADRLAHTFRHARDLAQQRQTVCQVTVDPELRLVEFEDLAAALEGGVGGEPRRWEVPPEITVRLDRRRAFLFAPDGGAPRIDVVLANSRGRTARVSFEPLSGLPLVEMR
jgi:general secretion pathway protein H